VIGPRQDGEAGVGEEPEERHGVLGADDVAVADHDQGRGGNRPDLRRGPAPEIDHPLHALGEEGGEVLRAGGRCQVGGPQLRRHLLEFRPLERLPEGGVGPLPVGHGRLDDQFAHRIRMIEGDLQGDVAAVAVAEEVGPGDFEVPEEGDGVSCRPGEGEGTAGDVGGAAVPLLLEGDHLPSRRQQRQDLAEGGVDGRAAAVQQEQRHLAGVFRAVNFVIDAQAIDRSVAARHRGWTLSPRDRSGGQDRQKQGETRKSETSSDDHCRYGRKLLFIDNSPSPGIDRGRRSFAGFRCSGRHSSPKKQKAEVPGKDLKSFGSSAIFSLRRSVAFRPGLTAGLAFSGSTPLLRFHSIPNFCPVKTLVFHPSKR